MQAHQAEWSLIDQLRRDLGRGTSDLPQLPHAVTEALRLARDPNPDPDAVAMLAAKDPPLTARLLSVANSAVYRRGGALNSAKQALVRIGQQGVRDLLFQSSYASMVVKVPRFSAIIEESFHHGVATATVARDIARRCDLDGDLAYIAGLLHDVGRPRCLKLIVTRAPHADDESVRVAVDELHAQAGAQLAAAWRLPDEVVEVCATHHAAEGRYARLVAGADSLCRLVEERAERAEVVRALAKVGITEDIDGLVLVARKAAEEGT